MENPFLSTVISDWQFLDSQTGRSSCPRCNKSRKYYCYSCLVVLPHLADRVPKVKLPVKVDIIKHPSEIDGKSTSVHAAILAPEDVTVHTYPSIPDYHGSDTVLVFPGKDAVSLEELQRCLPETNLRLEDALNKETEEKDNHNVAFQKPLVKLTVNEHIADNALNLCKDSTEHQHLGQLAICRKRLHDQDKEKDKIDEPQKKQSRIEKICPFQKVVFIDSTWNQTRTIVTDERLQDLKRVELKSQNTNFWRSQEGIPKTYLSTIEAIYYFIKDIHCTFIDKEYHNEYDNLLFFFCFMYNKIKFSTNNCNSKHKK